MLLERSFIPLRGDASTHGIDRPQGHLTRTTDVVIKATEFWAFLRPMVIPTASSDSLDAAAILAG
jgi:hypothetical protein